MQNRSMTDGLRETAYAFSAKKGQNVGEIEIDLGELLEFNCLKINEKLDKYGQSVKSFSRAVWEDGKWREVTRSTTIGARKILLFPKLKAQKVRLNILDAKGPVAISEIQLFRVD